MNKIGHFGLIILRVAAAVVLLGIAKSLLVEGGYPYARPGAPRHDWRLIAAGFAIGAAAWLLVRGVWPRRRWRH